MADYAPIACMDHERLEYAVLKRQPLLLVWEDSAGVEQSAQAVPSDVYTRDSAEWIEFRLVDGTLQRVRLDFIRSVKSL